MAHAFERTLDFSQPNSSAIPFPQGLIPFSDHNDTDDFNLPHPSQLATLAISGPKMASPGSADPNTADPADPTRAKAVSPSTELLKPKTAGSRRVAPFTAKELFQLMQAAVTVRFYEAGHGQKKIKDDELLQVMRTLGIQGSIAVFKTRLSELLLWHTVSSIPFSCCITGQFGFSGPRKGPSNNLGHHQQLSNIPRPNGSASRLPQLDEGDF